MQLYHTFLLIIGLYYNYRMESKILKNEYYTKEC